MDPLRPFSDLIRALWKSGASRVDRTERGAASREASAERPSAALEPDDPERQSLEAALAVRLRQVGLGDPRRVREIFVETVMTRELGLGTPSSAAFTELSRRIADRIGSHTRLSARLHALLTALAGPQPRD
jgi:UDP-N-acetylmuramyl tripeptide synthase